MADALGTAFVSEEALCAQSDPDLWFGGPDVPMMHAERFAAERAAVAMCQLCPVRVACLQHSLDTREVFGVWGGLNPRQRDKMLGRKAQVA